MYNNNDFGTNQKAGTSRAITLNRTGVSRNFKTLPFGRHSTETLENLIRKLEALDVQKYRWRAGVFFRARRARQCAHLFTRRLIN